MSINIVNPIESISWDACIKKYAHPTIFHHSGWAKVLHNCYGYDPLYFLSTNGIEFKGAVPVMEVSSLLTGRRGVSLPFSDECQPLVQSCDQFNEILSEIVQYGLKRRWKYIDFKGGEEFLSNTNVFKSYVTHSLSLERDCDSIFSKLKTNTKRNIKKAMNYKVIISTEATLDSVYKYYKLHCLTRKNKGLPPQPKRFFTQIYENIIGKGKGYVILAHLKSDPIAGAIYFHDGDTALYKFGASDRRYLNLRPNNLVMWEAIKIYAQANYKYFNFGRTDLTNDGLIAYKRSWNTVEKRLLYYRYDLHKRKFVRNKSGKEKSNVLLEKIPQFVLRIIGEIFYKHIA